jgi:hypothetical protein
MTVVVLFIFDGLDTFFFVAVGDSVGVAVEEPDGDSVSVAVGEPVGSSSTKAAIGAAVA